MAWLPKSRAPSSQPGKAYIDEQGTLEDPTWLCDRAPSTPINDTAIAAYRTHYSVYATLVRLPMPRSAGDPTQLSQSIAACRTEVAKITFDVPPDLQRFFQAIQLGHRELGIGDARRLALARRRTDNWSATGSGAPVNDADARPRPRREGA